MREAGSFGKLLGAIGSIFGSSKSPHFNCGDCDRNAQCGLPPHDDCPERLLQIARDGEPLPHHADYIYPAIWPR